MEHILEILISKNTLIIEVLFGTVLVGLIYLTVRSFMRPEIPEGSIDLSGIESGLKKILQNYTPQAATSGNGAPSIVGKGSELTNEQAMEIMAEVEKLKSELSEKKSEIEALKVEMESSQSAAKASSGAAAGDSAGGDASQTQMLQEKVKDLEAKLSEYAIIEDDIADLSFYKEETARLQLEVDQLKARLAEYEATGAPVTARGGEAKAEDVSADSSPAPMAKAPTPAAEPEVVASAPAAKAPSANETAAPVEVDVEAKPESTALPESERVSSTKEESVSTAAANPAATAETKAAEEPLPFTPAPSLEVDDDIMAEFEKAVAEQKAAGAQQNVVKEVPPEAAQEQGEQGAAEGAPAGESDSEGRSINLDKMVSEAAALPETEGGDPANALEQSLDADKLLEEASGMSKIDSEAINEFDKFLKKEGA